MGNCCSFGEEPRSAEKRPSGGKQPSSYYQNPNALLSDPSAHPVDREKVAAAAEKRMNAKSGSKKKQTATTTSSSSTTALTSSSSSSSDLSDTDGIPSWLQILLDENNQAVTRKESEEEIDAREALKRSVDFYFGKLSQIVKQRKERRPIDIEAAEVDSDDLLLFEFQKDDQFALQQKANRLPLPKLRELVSELKKYVELLSDDKVSQLSGRNPEKDVLIGLINMHDNGKRDINYFTLYKKSTSELRSLLRSLRASSTLVLKPSVVDSLL